MLSLAVVFGGSLGGTILAGVFGSLAAPPARGARAKKCFFLSFLAKIGGIFVMILVI